MPFQKLKNIIIRNVNTVNNVGGGIVFTNAWNVKKKPNDFYVTLINDTGQDFVTGINGDLAVVIVDDGKETKYNCSNDCTSVPVCNMDYKCDSGESNANCPTDCANVLGVVYIDANNNGSHDAGEQAIQDTTSVCSTGTKMGGVKISWAGATVGKAIVNNCNPNPYYSFFPSAGSNKIEIEITDGWKATTNLPGNLFLENGEERHLWFGIAPICVPNSADGCKICKADGSGWVDDNYQCAAGQICRSGKCVFSGGGGSGGTIIKKEEIKSAAKMTREQIMAKINEIVALIVKLQAQLKAMIGGAKYSCTQITKVLRYGIQNDSEVKCLQEVLKTQGYAVIASGNYDLTTKNAVIKFQQKYAKEILTPYGLRFGSGNVGNSTMAKLNQIIGVR